jgi:Apc13p protein
MSKDASHTYIHMHSSHHADLFEEFCRPPSSGATAGGPSNTNGITTAGGNPSSTSDPSMQSLPGSFLPYESINLPPHLQPVNPEDEDDVVPDMHAAFGILRALGTGQEGERAEPAWRDLGLGALVDGGKRKDDGVKVGGPKREGKKTGLLLMR